MFQPARLEAMNYEAIRIQWHSSVSTISNSAFLYAWPGLISIPVNDGGLTITYSSVTQPSEAFFTFLIYLYKVPRSAL